VSIPEYAGARSENGLSKPEQPEQPERTGE